MLLVGTSLQPSHSCPPKTSQSSTWSCHQEILLNLIWETGTLEQCLAHLHPPGSLNFSKLVSYISQVIPLVEPSTHLVKDGELCFESGTCKILNLRIRPRFLAPKLIAWKCQNLEAYTLQKTAQMISVYKRWDGKSKHGSLNLLI